MPKIYYLVSGSQALRQEAIQFGTLLARKQQNEKQSEKFPTAVKIRKWLS